ncbi:MAG: purine/pyrimidine permease, partial [Clostridium perfringens]|nr:purine/pyrimidine permease [Clostridium perfringens]
MYFSIGIPIFAGIGIMGVPKSAFANMPSAVTTLLSNGLVIGIILAFIIEIMILIKNRKIKEQN